MHCTKNFVFVIDVPSFQIADVAIEALRSLGIPIGNVNNANLQDEGFWHRSHLSLENGRRHGMYREHTYSIELESWISETK